MKILNCIGIDDEEDCNEYLRECCQKIPFINLLGTFTDPYAALPLIRSGEIDLIFLDFYLRKIEAPVFIKEIPEDIQVVIISAELEYKIMDHNMKLAAILRKPYLCERLLEVCRIASNCKPK
jgi:response regulator of citrate/malate metabolism